MMNIKQIIAHVCILVGITAVMGGLMVFVNGVTAPQIQLNQMAGLLELKDSIFPEGGDFTLEEAQLPEGLFQYFEFTDGSGFLMVTTVAGWGGPLEVATGIREDGTIAGIGAGTHSETPGLGTRVFEEDFTFQFQMAGAGGRFTTSPDEEGHPIDVISGATVSSQALLEAVNLALDIFWTLKEAR